MKKRRQLNYIPASLPVMVGFEEDGSWYGLDYYDNHLRIAPSKDDGEEIETMSFLEFARMVCENSLSYIYPEAPKDQQIQTITCTKAEMLETVKGQATMVYCDENDRIYVFTGAGNIIVDGESVDEEDMPSDSLYVLHPMTGKFGKNEENN